MKSINKCLKYYLFLFLVLNYFVTIAQPINNKIMKLENGSYFGETNATKVKLNILDNNKFEFVVYEGTFIQKGDTISFIDAKFNNGIFNVKFYKQNVTSQKIYLNFENHTSYDILINIFVGIQKSSNSTIEYKSLYDIKNDIPVDHLGLKNSPVELDKMYALYLVLKNVENEALIEKYIIPADVSNINIDLPLIKAFPLEIKAKIDTITRKLEMINLGNDTINFSLNKDAIIDENINPIKKSTQKNWTYPGKPKDKSDYFDSVTQVTEPADSIDLHKNYKFELKIEKSLKNALKENKKQKNKILVIVYDQEANFESIILYYETYAGYDMPKKYSKEYDYFNFYNATKKDKSALKKYLKNDAPGIIFVDGNGTQLFQTKSTHSRMGIEIYTLRSVIKSIVLQVQFDAVMQNKKSTTKQLIQAFTDVNNYTQEFIFATDTGTAPLFLPEGENLSEEVKIAVKRTKEELIDATTKAANEAVDAVVNDTETGYNAIDENEYLKKEYVFKMISTKEEVNKKWLSILEKQNSTNFNEDIAKIAIDELKNNGFNKKLFKAKKADENYKNLDYILDNYQVISKLKFKESDEDYFYITNTILVEESNKILSNKISENTEKGKEIHDVSEIKNYYKKIINITENSTAAIKAYLEVLKKLGLNQEFVDIYDAYFQLYFKENTNLIEQLDSDYQKQSEYTSWTEFKNNFANDANSAAWQIVENSNDPETIKKAIKWSEASLMIDKTSHYYFDTLAQLYYKNGEKDKAIATEMKAIENTPKTDEESIKGYIEVLKKMKK